LFVVATELGEKLFFKYIKTRPFA